MVQKKVFNPSTQQTKAGRSLWVWGVASCVLGLLWEIRILPPCEVLGQHGHWGRMGQGREKGHPKKPGLALPTPSGCLSSGSRSFFLSRAPSLIHTFAHAVPLCWEATPHPLYPTYVHKIPYPRAFLSNAHQAKSNSPWILSVVPITIIIYLLWCVFFSFMLGISVR